MHSAEAPCRIEIRRWSEAFALARPIREAVFVREQKVPRELEWDQADGESLHALAFDAQGRPVGTARLLPDGRIGRMAVLRAFRGRGIGTALARSLIGEAARKGFSEVVLNAQLAAVGFYRRLGFSETGPVFEEAGIAHVRMRLALAARGKS